MLRALWFLLKLSALVAIVTWFMQNPGAVEITWQGYIVDTSVGFIVTAFAIFLFLYTTGHSLWRSFTGAPDLWRKYRASRRRELGYRDVTAGLVAIAAGDAHTATKYARRSEALIPDAPLAKLLIAQSHLLNGDAAKARKSFAGLLDDQSAAFFGVKAMLQETLNAGDHRAALEHARTADKMQPGRVWIARTLFDLETRNREWDKAGKALKTCTRLGIFTPDESRRHKQALLLAEAEIFFFKGDVVRAHKRAATAFALDPAFTPAALRLVKYYTQVGKRSSALKVILKAYEAAPHPALADAWMAARPQKRKTVSPTALGDDIYNWAQTLYRLKPDHRDSLKMMGAAARAARRFPEARDVLTRAADYRGLAKLEEAENGNTAKARLWLEEAADAPPEAKWICGSCGHGDTDWAPLCPRCGTFDSASWAVPDGTLRAIPHKEKPLGGDILATTKG